MVIHMPRMITAKHIFRHSLSGNRAVLSAALDVPKGYFAVQEKKRFVIPISFLNQPAFQELLSHDEEEFGLIIQWVVLRFLAEKTS